MFCQSPLQSCCIQISFSSFTASGDERRCVFLQMWKQDRWLTSAGQRRQTERVEHVGKCGLWSTCICCANFLNRLANRTGSGQGALGLVLEDGGGEFLEGAAQQVRCLLGPLMTCKLFPASWDTCMKTTISPPVSYSRDTAAAPLHPCLWQVGIMCLVKPTMTQLVKKRA